MIQVIMESIKKLLQNKTSLRLNRFKIRKKKSYAKIINFVSSYYITDLAITNVNIINYFFV